jgi:hypothetical protein
MLGCCLQQAFRSPQGVANLLLDLGVPADRLTVEGLGSYFRGYVTDHDAACRLIPQGAAANRTVTTQLGGVPCSGDAGDLGRPRRWGAVSARRELPGSPLGRRAVAGPRRCREIQPVTALRMGAGTSKRAGWVTASSLGRGVGSFARPTLTPGTRPHIPGSPSPAPIPEAHTASAIAGEKTDGAQLKVPRPAH